MTVEPSEQRQESQEIEDSTYAWMLSNSVLEGFHSEGRRPRGHTGYGLVFHQHSKSEGERDSAQPVTVELGEDLVELLHTFSPNLVPIERASYQAEGLFRGRMVALRLIGGRAVFLKMGVTDLVSMKIFHNPALPANPERGTEATEERHFIQIGEAPPQGAKSKGTIQLDKDDHPTADLILKENMIIYLNGARVT